MALETEESKTEEKDPSQATDMVASENKNAKSQLASAADENGETAAKQKKRKSVQKAAPKVNLNAAYELIDKEPRLSADMKKTAKELVQHLVETDDEVKADFNEIYMHLVPKLIDKILKETDQDVTTPAQNDELDKQSSSIKKLESQYKTIAKEFAKRFANNPEDAEKMAKFALKVFNSPKWVEWLKGKENDRAVIQNKIIPTLVKAYNAKNQGDQIELPKQVNDDTRESLKDRNGNASVSLVVPEGFNKELVELGDQAISIDLGYPMVNFNSVLIKEIVRESDKKRLKKLLKALIKKLEGTPAAEAFLQRSFIGNIKASTLYKLIDQAKDAKGVPMIRRPLKVPAKDLVGDSESSTISVIPVNNLGNEAKDPSKTLEAIDMYDLSPLYESYQTKEDVETLYENWFNGKIDTTSKNKYGAPVDVPKIYLQQYYTVLMPTGASGLTRYASYITQYDKENMLAKLDKGDVEAIKESNRNVNDALIKAYLEKTDGVPPFYILVARSNPTKERLRVCDDIKVGKNVCIKSIDGRNKDAYYIPEDVVDAIFEAG